MNENILEEMRSHAREIFNCSLIAVDPYEAVKRFINVEGNMMSLGLNGHNRLHIDLSGFANIYIVGAGKATAPMALAIEDLLGERIKKGLINVKYGFSVDLGFIEIIEADHPLPDQNGVDGTARILDILTGASLDDLVISLISGGGSALLPHPAGGITLAEKQAITRSLLSCGASIDEINAIRKHISLSKGGQMARAAYPATIVNLMLSDVVGDRMDVIASGPFVPDDSTFEDALGIIRSYNLENNIPTSISNHLKAGAEGRIPDTPKKGDAIFGSVHNFIIGSNIIALEAARGKARELGYDAMILSSVIEGETREISLAHVAVAREVILSGNPLHPPACIISGGETTVTIKGKGLGGRNQEFCLAAALELAKLPSRIVVLSGGTDGNDGPTDAAGAIVDHFSVSRGLDKGCIAQAFLDANDSYHFFEKTGELLKTGPTKTNVMDVRIMLLK